MTETTPSIPTPFTATDKARLITDALDSLRGADAIDERETLDAETWVAWYDATLPQVRDIKILAGAMDIELAKRRGAQVVAEGERRGGDQSKVTHRLTLLAGVLTQPAAWVRHHVEACVDPMRRPPGRSVVCAICARIVRVRGSACVLEDDADSHAPSRIRGLSGQPGTVVRRPPDIPSGAVRPWTGPGV